MKHAVRAEDAPKPAGPYSQGIVAGPFVFVAGQGPSDPQTDTTPEGIEAQTQQVLHNIEAILRGGGCAMRDIVQVTVHPADLADFQAFNQVYRQYFQEPLPVRTTVGSQLNHILVEADVIAYREEP